MVELRFGTHPTIHMGEFLILFSPSPKTYFETLDNVGNKILLFSFVAYNEVSYLGMYFYSLWIGHYFLIATVSIVTWECCP